MTRTVAEVMVDVLISAGSRRCCGVPGDTLNYFTDAVRRSTLRWVHVRHEEGGAMAAGADALLSGELALCAGSCGPGSAVVCYQGASMLVLRDHVTAKNCEGRSA